MENFVDSSNKAPQVEKQPLAAMLLVPLSLVFVSVIISSSLILSANILGNKIKEASTTTTAATQQTTTATSLGQVGQASLNQVKEVFKGNYIKFGDENRKVLFVEFSDPSCPYCHAAGGKDPELNRQIGTQFILTTDGGTYLAPVPEMKKLVDEGKASYAWVYVAGHGNGEMGTKALYCANEQGKFWEVHDLLMSYAGYNLLNNTVKNDKSKSQDLADFLKNAIDSSFMKNCLDSGKYDSRLTSDPQLGSTFGVQGTPGFYVGNMFYNGAYSFNDMKPEVDKYIGKEEPISIYWYLGAAGAALIIAGIITFVFIKKGNKEKTKKEGENSIETLNKPVSTEVKTETIIEQPVSSENDKIHEKIEEPTSKEQKKKSKNKK